MFAFLYEDYSLNYKQVLWILTQSCLGKHCAHAGCGKAQGVATTFENRKTQGPSQASESIANWNIPCWTTVHNILHFGAFRWETIWASACLPLATNLTSKRGSQKHARCCSWDIKANPRAAVALLLHRAIVENTPQMQIAEMHKVLLKRLQPSKAGRHAPDQRPGQAGESIAK